MAAEQAPNERPLEGFRPVERDLLYVAVRESGKNAVELRRDLEAAYDTPINQQTVYTALDDLESKGLVEKERIGRENEHAVTDDGRERLVQHANWTAACLENES